MGTKLTRGGCLTLFRLFSWCGYYERDYTGVRSVIWFIRSGVGGFSAKLFAQIAMRTRDRGMQMCVSLSKTCNRYRKDCVTLWSSLSDHHSLTVNHSHEVSNDEPQKVPFPNILISFFSTQMRTLHLQTWDLSKYLHDQIFGPKFLHTKSA